MAKKDTFDISLVHSRYFNVKIGNVSVDLEPCTLKTLRKFDKREVSYDEMARLILNKNKQNYIFDDEIIDELTIDQLKELTTHYFKWIKSTRDNDPN